MNWTPFELEALLTLIVWKVGSVKLDDNDLARFEEERKKFGLHLVTNDDGIISVVGEGT